MPWIQNVSYEAIQYGIHLDPSNAILIQITDKGMSYPYPKHKFNFIFKFDFLDVDTYIGITQQQAKEIVEALKFALATDKNVIVHCHAGLCRSGAVSEVGIIMGFEDTNAPRLPNMRVKTFMMRELGLSYE